MKTYYRTIKLFTATCLATSILMAAQVSAATEDTPLTTIKLIDKPLANGNHGDYSVLLSAKDEQLYALMIPAVLSARESARQISSDITLKRGVVSNSFEKGLQATFDTQIVQHNEYDDQFENNLMVAVQAETKRGNEVGGEIILVDIVGSANDLPKDLTSVFEPILDDAAGGKTEGLGGGDIILVDIVGASASTLELHFQADSETQQLSGEPAYLFNTPEPGEDLVMIVPRLKSDEILSEQLKIYRDDYQNPQLVHIGGMGMTIWF